MSKYDFLLVGAGLFNAVFAREATRHGKKCLVVERRNHIGGNLYCETVQDIIVQKYGAHIFHTSNKQVWEYMSELCEFNHYINSPLARYKDKVYNLPFNMNTFYRLWGIITPGEAKNKIEAQRLKTANPQNAEEQALSLVGHDIYEKLVKGYTEKQWGMAATLLPSFIIKRLPLRFTYDNNYFNDVYQGIPNEGYNPIFEKCFEDCDLILNEDFFENKKLKNKAKEVIFTGMIDRYFDYCFGPLAYRSLCFETETLDTDNFQGNAVVNYTEREVPYTRIIEHKHFNFGTQVKTVITREYPLNWQLDLEPYYPVNTQDNMRIYEQYKSLAKQEHHVYFCGRLGTYAYCNMDETVEMALNLYKKITTY
ncbi:MAG: UDP-galactopyranose mutase [Dysgonamonadaceae bacterium]|jgi:UDP-galactopyranose mutase|nr:UDP-galactopyranose mutase [Dysgonamonadaceae bacterium]